MPSKWDLDKLRILDDEKFIDLFCTATADRSNLDFKSFVFENKKKNIAPKEALDNLLAEAHRRQIPLSIIATRFAEKAFAGKSFVSNLCAPTSWRKYEIHAAASIIQLLKSQKVELDSIEYDARILGLITKGERQVDLLLKREKPKHYVACEIKNYDSKVAVDKVEAFVTKIKDIGADYGVMVTPNGFQQSAIATANQYKVKLFTLRELLGVDVPDELKAKGPIDEVKPYWVLECGEQKWIFSGNLTTNRR